MGPFKVEAPPAHTTTPAWIGRDQPNASGAYTDQMDQFNQTSPVTPGRMRSKLHHTATSQTESLSHLRDTINDDNGDEYYLPGLMLSQMSSDFFESESA